MSAFATAGGGFLLAVLWFDLMFDVQVSRHRGPELPEEVLASIAGYYRRVTTSARPMNRLIALVMLATLIALVVEAVRGDGPGWVPWASLAVTVPPIALAGGRTVPSAVRLGTRRDSASDQSRLARSICHQHVFCASAIAALLVLQLAFAGSRQPSLSSSTTSPSTRRTSGQPSRAPTTVQPSASDAIRATWSVVSSMVAISGSSFWACSAGATPSRSAGDGGTLATGCPRSQRACSSSHPARPG